MKKLTQILTLFLLITILFTACGAEEKESSVPSTTDQQMLATDIQNPDGNEVSAAESSPGQNAEDPENDGSGHDSDPGEIGNIPTISKEYPSWDSYAEGAASLFADPGLVLSTPALLDVPELSGLVELMLGQGNARMFIGFDSSLTTLFVTAEDAAAEAFLQKYPPKAASLEENLMRLLLAAANDGTMKTNDSENGFDVCLYLPEDQVDLMPNQSPAGKIVVGCHETLCDLMGNNFPIGVSVDKKSFCPDLNGSLLMTTAMQSAGQNYIAANPNGPTADPNRPNDQSASPTVPNNPIIYPQLPARKLNPTWDDFIPFRVFYEADYSDASVYRHDHSVNPDGSIMDTYVTIATGQIAASSYQHTPGDYTDHTFYANGAMKTEHHHGSFGDYADAFYEDGTVYSYEGVDNFWRPGKGIYFSDGSFCIITKDTDGSFIYTWIEPDDPNRR